MTTGYSDKEKSEDIKVLHGMGYAQELSRSMSKFSNFAISFSIICILSGGINSFAQAISSVGGAGAGIMLFILLPFYLFILTAGPVAALAAGPPQADVTQSVQAELRRVGCLTGNADGNWNSTSQRSLVMTVFDLRKKRCSTSHVSVDSQTQYCRSFVLRLKRHGTSQRKNEPRGPKKRPTESLTFIPVPGMWKTLFAF